MRQGFKTARCILYREDRFLLAVHNNYWRARERRWGLPGGQIERGEPPSQTARRELREELYIQVHDLLEIGTFSYKQALHVVYAAPFEGDIGDYDDRELVEIGWFGEAAIAEFKAGRKLHAGYELEAVQSLQSLLAGQPKDARKR